MKTIKPKASYQHLSCRIANPSVRIAHESFGERLAWLRTKTGMTQKQFADYVTSISNIEGVKLTASDVRAYESERHVAKTNKQALIQKAFGLDADFFEGATRAKYDMKAATARAKAFLKALEEKR